ncbi:HNH endonuclease [Hydrogenophaga sp. YM1]|uniref:HNH endonuclease signature motif containing protein n=1 Tax=Hydrogenophaga sp. YM1 TaxID=2806262 RepID=UPI00195C0011|nr:HNH endonuclease signature motif containing protein [Hydrogenophaga sp. YM1]QRR36025.1 HNH endonuclease [Hydrogenophaga sp. YM1]
MQRVAIPAEVAADVLFRSDRTCCVCRDRNRKVEIHHLDENPRNNEMGNLIVLCKDCHSDAHTTHAFARNLNLPLLRKYNESWQDIVRLRIAPGGLAAEELEYRSQVLLDLHLAPYRWKNAYMDLYPGQFRDSVAWVSDGWEYLIENSKHTFTQENWDRYKRLFSAIGPAVADEIERLVTTYGDALRPRVKVQILRTAQHLRVMRLAYSQLPEIAKQVPENQNLIFERQFTQVLETLMALSRLADAERKAIEPEHSAPGAILGACAIDA